MNHIHPVFWKAALGRITSKCGCSRTNSIRFTAAVLALVWVAPAWSQADLLPKKPMNSEGVKVEAVVSCQVPHDSVPRRSWPLFKARELMHGVIASYQNKEPKQ